MFFLLATTILLGIISASLAEKSNPPPLMGTLRRSPEELAAVPPRNLSVEHSQTAVHNVFDHVGFPAKIVGGRPAEDIEYPFLAHVIDDPDVVLTAAHCIGAYSSDVIIGSNDLHGRDGAERIDIEFILPHPDYYPNTVENDIMLVKLASPSSGPLVTLNTDPNLPQDGQAVTVIGFGLTSEGGDISVKLLDVEVKTVDFETCNRQLSEMIFPETHICAGVAPGGKDSCSGDSGSPLLDSATKVQYGIVSFGVGCARTNSPGVYTRISAFSDWIESFICHNSTQPPASYDISVEASEAPSRYPSGLPSLSPTKSSAPSLAPATSQAPSGSSMPTESASPSDFPSTATSDFASGVPSAYSSDSPSLSPTLSQAPSGSAMPTKTVSPSLAPSGSPIPTAETEDTKESGDKSSKTAETEDAKESGNKSPKSNTKKKKTKSRRIRGRRTLV
jgi:trypsin